MIPTCPVPEIWDINIIHGDLVAPQEGKIMDVQQRGRPARLRQNVRPPLRFGEYVIH